MNDKRQKDPTVEKCFIYYRTLQDKNILSNEEPFSPQERIAWWLRMAEILYFNKKQKLQAERAVRIARNIANKFQIQLTRRFKILSRFPVDNEPVS